MGQSAFPEASLSLHEQDIELLARGVRIIALRSLGTADAAQEVVQETLARTVQALAQGRLRERAALGGFVRSVARHVIADEIRRRARTIPLSPAPDSEAFEPAVDHDPLDAMVRHEQVAALRRALARLSPGDRRVLLLSFVSGLTPAAVADRLHEPVVRIRKRKSRALERLRQIFLAAEPGHDAGPTPTLSLERDGDVRER